MIAKTEAIVLKSFDYRETSRIATFFTREYGKVSGVLKGIRKDPKKFGSSVASFSINDIVYYRYRNSDLHLISQCDLREFYFPIQQDLKRGMAASYVAELVTKIMPAEEANARIYRVMKHFFSALKDSSDINRLVHIFQIKTLLFSGFRPHLDACLKCKKTISGKALFSMKEGGLVCAHCHTTDTNIYSISQGTIAAILYIEKNRWENCLRLKLTEINKGELKHILNNFLVYHLGRRIRSAKYLEGIEKGGKRFSR
ncbi:MAG: DNA repair protein RecO [Candidatus Omnitrophica bacterium]|nr:DNA repair protein RecO [Candidatus Omnitrophota bacterium]